MKINQDREIIIQCPYCHTYNNMSIRYLNDSWSGNIIVCDSIEARGCEKRFVVEITIEFKQTIMKVIGQEE